MSLASEPTARRRSTHPWTRLDSARDPLRWSSRPYPTSAGSACATRHTLSPETTRSFRDVVAAYVGLTKPRVIELLLLTTVPVMFFAQRGVPPLGLVAATVRRRHPLGRVRLGAKLRLRPRHRRADATHPPTCAATAHRLAALGARLRHRAGGRLDAGAGLLGQLAVAPASRWLANAFYVFVYTMVLKRRTTQNIVWGGLAGCFPALIGWTAVTGELAWTPVILFARRLLLDAAAHLGAGAALPRGLRRRRRADAAGRGARRRGRPPDRRSTPASWSRCRCCSGRSPSTGRFYPVAAARPRRGVPGRGAPHVAARAAPATTSP